MRRFLLASLLLCVAAGSLFARTDPFMYPLQTVFVDAGHGGKDTGATRTYSWGRVDEKEVTLDVASKVVRELSGSGLKVIMTRGDDSFVSLADRCKIAYTTPLEAKSSALFLSIHVNSAPNSGASGYEVLVRHPSRSTRMLDRSTPKANIPLFAAWTDSELNDLLNADGKKVAAVLDGELMKAGFTSRGVKEQDVQVLRESRTPAVLLELGFLTNEAEARKLMDETWRTKMAQAVARAILSLRNMN